jgi:regulator of CtrA degradation
VNGPDVIALNQDPVRFARNFVRSDAFRALFQEGMELVEEAAAYLDGPGRAEARALPRQAVMAYASESMRLTTGLMQIASWLLLKRAVAEGEQSLDEDIAERGRVRLSGPDPEARGEDLPIRLRELIGLAVRFQARILHLELLIAQGEAPSQASQASQASGANPVAAQHSLLARAFAPAAPD